MFKSSTFQKYTALDKFYIELHWISILLSSSRFFAETLSPPLPFVSPFAFGSTQRWHVICSRPIRNGPEFEQDSKFITCKIQTWRGRGVQGQEKSKEDLKVSLKCLFCLCTPPKNQVLSFYCFHCGLNYVMTWTFNSNGAQWPRKQGSSFYWMIRSIQANVFTVIGREVFRSFLCLKKDNVASTLSVLLSGLRSMFLQSFAAR